jgi:hypothetical protein
MAVKQIWETEEDRKREQEIADFFAKKWNCTVNKVAGNHEIDFTFHRGSDAVAFYGECRYKNHRHGSFPDVFCGLKKLHFADNQRRNGKQTRFLIKWKCGTYGWTDLKAPDEIIYGGRSVGAMRNDEDREPLGLYSIHRFRIIKDERETGTKET